VMSKLPLNTFDCVVAIGGDGMLSEIVQGLMLRSDWHKAILQPLGIVPGGSGNGLCASLLYKNNERYDPLNATFAIAKGKIREFDIATVRNPATNKQMYCFLGLEWAFFADVDIESERLRMLGGLRFTVAAVGRLLLSRKVYKGTVRYIDESHATAKPPVPFHELSDRSQKDQKRPKLVCLSDLEPTVAKKQHHWKEISGNFAFFWGVSASHGTSDSLLAPQAKMNDGYMHLVIMDGNASRFELTKALLALETGNHIGNPHVQVIKTRACSLKVTNKEDLICVDGELMEGPHVEMEIHRAMGRLVTL